MNCCFTASDNLKLEKCNSQISEIIATKSIPSGCGSTMQFKLSLTCYALLENWPSCYENFRLKLIGSKLKVKTVVLLPNLSQDENPLNVYWWWWWS